MSAKVIPLFGKMPHRRICVLCECVGAVYTFHGHPVCQKCTDYFREQARGGAPYPDPRS